MINYDLPWNPNRLEQRMGRIHRIGQEHEVYIFNFAAVNTVEGRVLNRLLTKLEEIRMAMGDRVFDVIGQLLQLNDIRFEELVREATYTPALEDEALEQIERLNPERLEALEQATGVALATTHVDLSQIRRTQTQDYVSEEQRLMPRYVEEFFKRACEHLRVNLETRADGLWRVPYVKEEFRSHHLESIRRLGTPEKNYPKLTFYKENLATAAHQDADLCSPGHPLFAAIAERPDTQLFEAISHQAAVFIDADAEHPYRIHFFDVQVVGVGRKGEDNVLKARLCAVAEDATGALTLISPDCLHDLAPVNLAQDGVIDRLSVSSKISEEIDNPSATKSSAIPTPGEQQQVENWLKVKIQLPLMNQERSQRQRELQIRQDYLKQAMESAIRDAQRTQMKLAAKVAGGDETYRVARDAAQNKVRNLQERYKNKQNELDYLKIVRPGRVAYLGTALVQPAPVEVSIYPGMRNDPEVEAFAMHYVIDFERQRGWETEDVSKNQDGSGFDIRSVGPVDLETGMTPVRRIELKGRAQRDLEVSLTVNEWRKAQQLGDSYWLYVVWGCKTPNPELLMIPNPAKTLVGNIKEIKQVTRYIISAGALQQGALSEL